MEDHEAEKLINLSLCKMASSRGFRRGGSSLHKHLLIASVLTKARSAFFENWYMTDELGEGSGSGTEEEDDDEDDSTDESSAADTSDDSIDEEQMAMNNNQIVDPRLFVESEIELPADILSCVEKLGSLGDMDFLSHNNLSASVVGQSEEDMEETSSPDRGEGESTRAAAEMYLELDATAAAPASVNNIDNDSDISLRNDDSSVTEDGLRVLSKNSKASSASSNISFGSGRLNFKRRRVSESESIPVAEEGDSHANFLSSEANVLVNTAKRLRTSGMAVGEVFDAKETDHFFGEGLDQTGVVTAETMAAQENKDRRVPCTSSSSNSSSDEEFEESMEVDQITNLVQYFSFSHKQEEISKPATTMNTTPATTNSSTASTSTKATKSSSSASAGLIRSVSSPDLCRELSNPQSRCLVVTT